MTTKEKERKTKNAARKTNDCLCGCETKVRGHFAQGHDQRFRGYVLRVEQGTATKDEAEAVKRAARQGFILARGTTQPNAPLLKAAA